MNDKLIDTGKIVIQELNFFGYKGYFVGGAVRDLHLKRKIKDIDIATDASPQEVMKIFSDTIPTGLKHGTVTVIKDNVPIEVTTFRTENNYEDYRHPEEIKFVTDIYEDLSRRDFTMNAIAMDKDGNHIDPYKGKEALKEKLIITVGDPKERFLEDPLRMLRAVRFSAQLNFDIHDRTKEAISEMSGYLRNVSNERVKMEIDKIMESDQVTSGIFLLVSLGLFHSIRGLDNIDLPIQKIDIASIEQTEQLIIRWFLLLEPLQEKERLYVMKQMRFSKKEIDAIQDFYICYSMMIKGLNESNFKTCLLKKNNECCEKSLNLYLDRISISDEEKLKYQLLFKTSQEKLMVRNLKDLDLSGKDLKEYFNQDAGPWIGKVLLILLHKVVYEELENKKEVLLGEAKRLKKGIYHEGKN